MNRTHQLPIMFMYLNMNDEEISKYDVANLFRLDSKYSEVFPEIEFRINTAIKSVCASISNDNSIFMTIERFGDNMEYANLIIKPDPVSPNAVIMNSMSVVKNELSELYDDDRYDMDSYYFDFDFKDRLKLCRSFRVDRDFCNVSIIEGLKLIRSYITEAIDLYVRLTDVEL